MPPKKKARTMDEKQASKMPGNGNTKEGRKKNLFQEIGPDLHQVILSFLLDTNSEKYWYQSMRKGLASSVHGLLTVSKSWSSLTVKLVNQGAPKEIVSPEELAAIKSRARKLDLSLIRKNFIKDIKEKWGHLVFCNGLGEVEGGCLDFVLLNTFSGHGDMYTTFAEQICEEYRDFLVVKSLELMAAKEQPKDNTEEEEPNNIDVYKEKCMAPKIVDVFWHAHMLAPKKYGEDCNFLVGAIIDHEAQYVSPKQHSKSGYRSKKQNLFRFESRMPGHKSLYHRLCDDTFDDLEGKAGELLMEMADDYGCG